MLTTIFIISAFSWSVFGIYRKFKNLSRIKTDINEYKPVLTFRNMFYFISLYTSMTLASFRLNIPEIERLAAYGTIGILVLLVLLDFILAKKSNFKYFN